MDDLILFYPTGHEEHAEAGHPESPERVEAIRQALEQAGCWSHFPQAQPAGLPGELLASVHSPVYLQQLKSASQAAERLDWDTYTTEATWRLALQSAGGAVAVARTVWQGEARRGFALTRPPGHHATKDQGMGFCLLNNIALAAEDLIQSGRATRLAIVDLDLHHGNGTQDIFWRRGDVFYCSTHQYPLFPGTGQLDERGAGSGEGTTANFPFPPGSGDAAFQTVMDQCILPLLDRFQPEMILVSFGFDPHWMDPLGHLRLSAGVYGKLVGQLCAWADQHAKGRLALFLEGGYDLQAGAACALAVVAAMLGKPFRDPLGTSLRKEGTSWRIVVREAKKIWGLPT